MVFKSGGVLKWGVWSCKWPRGGLAREACRCLSWYSPGILETLTKLIKPVEASLGGWRSPLQLRLAQANPPLRLITHLWFRKGLIKCQLIGDKRRPFHPLLALIRAAWSLFTCVMRGLMRGWGWWRALSPAESRTPPSSRAPLHYEYIMYSTYSMWCGEGSSWFRTWVRYIRPYRIFNELSLRLINLFSS